MKKKTLTTAKPKRTKLTVTDRKLVQVTMQIFEDQKNALEKQANVKHKGRIGSKQGIIRDLLDQQGYCSKVLIAQ